MSAKMSDVSRNSLLALSLSVVAEAATTMAPETPAPVNVTVSPRYMEPVRVVRFNPALAAVVMAMVISFFVVGFATGYLKKCVRPAEADPEDQFVQRRRRSRTRGRTSKSECGLDPEIIEALPRVHYKDLPADEQARKYFDCPVCLAAFDANDCLRLLPVCSHAFHSDCIDVWFLSHSTCPLCRACLAPSNKASREERENSGEDGEQVEMRVLEGFDVIEVVIGGDAEQDRNENSDTSRLLQEQSGGAPMANSSTAEKEELVYAHPSLRSTGVGSFKPAVRVVIAPEKAEALASLRRSNSAGTDLLLLHPSYVIDSEGTQHNRNYQTHGIYVEEFLRKDHHGAHYHPSESSSGLYFDTGASSVTQPISRLGSQLVQSTRRSFPNLPHFVPAGKP